MTFENPFSRRKQVAEVPKQKASAERLRRATATAIEMFSTDFNVEGTQNIEAIRRLQSQNPKEKFIIASSHVSNLDAPAAVKALGDDLDIVITATSQSFGFTQQEILFRTAGKENFLPLTHTSKTDDKEARAVFNPNDFTPILEKMEQGKTPWIAAHEFTLKEEMQQAKTGSLYLAQKIGAYIVPTALEVQEAGSVSLDGPKETVKGLLKRGKLVYHVGEPYKPKPLDVEIIERVIGKRQRKEEISLEERTEFTHTIKKLKEQSRILGTTIADMLPEHMRGVYESKDSEDV